MTRIMELIPDFVERELLEGITGFRQEPIKMTDVAVASEVFMTGGSVPVAPVVQWDGRKIGEGTVGVGVLALRQMILEDMKPRPESDQHTVVPYGMLTGMPEDSQRAAVVPASPPVLIAAASHVGRASIITVRMEQRLNGKILLPWC
eukprot:TRINITY_DN12135_c0_g3_i1.p1 TRINITY_DN12135_c0_g3~~TRINITY_DN12135_c0_g3_i1.p1  ORF type:complete len:172 (-),score=19.86 TRINITY_DN12135_c0_g3_i1:72-512(-)